MVVVIICNEAQKAELLTQGVRPDAVVTWMENIEDLEGLKEISCVLDLLFEPSAARIAALAALLPASIIVNSVDGTLKALHPGFVRINGWNSFLLSTAIEGASLDGNKEEAQRLFSLFNKRIEWLPDTPGFVTPRVVSSIINEAYFTLEEGISTRAEIDLAMKLGTAYPFGPFEWGETIGLDRVASLLVQLSRHQPRYTPSALLLQEAAGAEK